MRAIFSFGWTLQDLRSRDVASFLLSSLQELDQQLDTDLSLELSDKHSGSIHSLTEGQFLEAISESKVSSGTVGGADVGSKCQSCWIDLDWSSNNERLFSKMRTIFEDRSILRDPQELAAWGRFWRSVAEELSFEYLYAAHDIDRDRKRRLPRHVQRKIKRGEAPRPTNLYAKPARALPYVPWLLILGPRYAEHFTLENLESIDAWESGRLSNGGYWLQTAESPLEFGKKEVVAREQSLVGALGREAFFDPSNPWRIAEGPDYPRVYKEWLEPPPGGTWDVYVDDKGKILKVDATEELKD